MAAPAATPEQAREIVCEMMDRATMELQNQKESGGEPLGADE